MSRLVSRSWMLSSLVCAAAALSACDALLPGDAPVYDDRIACEDGKCTCEWPYAECDGDVTNGCEADMRRSETCGACGHDCRGGLCAPDGSCSAVTIHASATFVLARYAVASDDMLFLADSKHGVVRLHPGETAATPVTDLKGLGTSAVVRGDTLFFSTTGVTGWRILATPVAEGPQPSPYEVVATRPVANEVPSIIGSSENHVHVWSDTALSMASRLDHTLIDVASGPDLRGWGSGGDRLFWIEGTTLFMAEDDAVAHPVADVSPIVSQPGSLLRQLPTDGEVVYAAVVAPGDLEHTDLWEIRTSEGTVTKTHEVAARGDVYPLLPLTIDASYVYLVTDNTKESGLWRFRRDEPGEPPLALSLAVGEPTQVEVTADAIYRSNLIVSQDGYWIGGTLHRLILPMEPVTK